MNTDIIEDITVDVALSFGSSCRAADALKRNNLRFFSSPFDWLMKYKLDTVYDILKDKGNNFLADYEEKDIPNGTKYRYIVSKSTGMIAMHHFYQHISLDEAYFLFNETVKRRFKTLDKVLENAKTICIVTSRKSETEKIISFLDKFLELYEFEKLYFINIYNDSNEEIIKTEYENAVIYQCHFSDVHPDGSDKTKNKKFWKGNIELWDSILNKVQLNQEFRKKYINLKTNKVDFKTALKVKYLNLKYNVLRILNIVTGRTKNK